MSILAELIGRTIKGKSLGRTMGFPTINIAYNGELSGVFAGKVFLDEEEYLAAISVGARPTLNDDTKLCESHLISWEGGDIDQGTEIKVQLVEKIRDVQKFENLERLKEQIAKDVEFVKTCYNR